MSLAEEMAVPPLDRVTAASAGTVDRHDTTETFESTDPATGSVGRGFPRHHAPAAATGWVVGVSPVHDAHAVREPVERARPAAERWRALGHDGRKQRLAA